MTTTHLSAPVSAPRRGGLARAGLAAAVAAALVTTLVAAAMQLAGVDYEIPDGGESVPLSGIATLTFAFSLVGLGLAAGIRRWTQRPRTRFIQVTGALTALSLVPPLLTGAGAGTVAALVALHLTAAAITIPTLARRLTD